MQAFDGRGVARGGLARLDLGPELGGVEERFGPRPAHDRRVELAMVGKAREGNGTLRVAASASNDGCVNVPVAPSECCQSTSTVTSIVRFESATSILA